MTVHLLDANVLIALIVAEHEHHDRATAWLSRADQFAVCPIVEGALLRFLLRMGESIATATAVLTGIRASSRCLFWPDSISYLDIDGSTVVGHRQVTDSYLVGLARARGGRLATLDTALAARNPDSCALVPET